MGDRNLKDWTGKSLCFACAQKLGASINIGLQFKGRCHRCHSEQTLFRAIDAPAATSGAEEVCSECHHPVGIHAAGCSRSELERLREDRREIVRLLEECGGYDPGHPLADQLRALLGRS